MWFRLHSEMIGNKKRFEGKKRVLLCYIKSKLKDPFPYHERH